MHYWWCNLFDEYWDKEVHVAVKQDLDQEHQNIFGERPAIWSNVQEVRNEGKHNGRGWDLIC